MKVFHGIEEFRKVKHPVVTIGTFDGVHLGHQKILQRVSRRAEELGGESVVITFWPHPRFILQPQHPTKLLNTLSEKISLLQNLGINNLLILPFTKDFAEWSSDQFISKVLIRTIGTEILIIGYDHRFGRNREGSFEYLRENSAKFGFEVEEISRQDIDHITISSTNIRRALEEGQPEKAETLLGRPYALNGEVIHGDKIGRKLGFPTANLQLEDSVKLIPADGVYVVEVSGATKKKLGGMMNIGFRPTIDGKKRILEVNIFDFNAEIYGEQLKVEFIAFLRKEVKFNSLDALKDQMEMDRQNTLRILRHKSSFSI